MDAVKVGTAIVDPDGDVGDVVGRTPSGLIVVDYDGQDVSWRANQLIRAPRVAARSKRKKKYPNATSGKIKPGIRNRLPKHLGGPGPSSGGSSSKKAPAKKKKTGKSDAQKAAEKAAREAERERKRREREAAKRQREEERAQRERARQKARGVKAAEKYKIKDPEFEQEVKRDASGQFSKTETAKNFTTNGGRVSVGDWVQTQDGQRRGRIMGRTKDGKVVIVSDDGTQTSHDRFALTREDRNDGGFEAGGTTWEEAVRTKRSSPEFLYAVDHEFKSAESEGRNPVFHLGAQLDATIKALRDAGHYVFFDGEGRVYMMWQGRKVRLKGYRRHEDDV